MKTASHTTLASTVRHEDLLLYPYVKQKMERAGPRSYQDHPPEVKLSSWIRMSSGPLAAYKFSLLRCESLISSDHLSPQAPYIIHSIYHWFYLSVLSKKSSSPGPPFQHETIHFEGDQLH